MNTRFITILKIAAWTVMSVLLLVVGLLLGTVKLLQPEQLTPIANKVANKMLIADVEMGEVKLSMRRVPLSLYVDIDDFTIRSKDIMSLPKSVRDTLPVWGDTLVSLQHLHGGVNLEQFCSGVVELLDLSVTRSQINVMVVNETLNNFSIVPSTDSDPDTLNPHLPDIRINRFELIDPQPIRFADMTNDFDMTIDIDTMSVANQTGEDGFLPAYNVRFSANVHSSLLSAIGRDHLPVGLGGVVEWHYERPYFLALNDLLFRTIHLSGDLSTKVDFSDLMTVESFNLNLNPVKANGILSLMPRSIVKKYNLPDSIDTNAEICLSARIDRPYVLGQIAMPYASAHMEIPDCRLKYGKFDLRRLALNAKVDFLGGTPDEMVVHIDKFNVQGPATGLGIEGKLTEIMSDPLFTGTIDGSLDIDRLPDMLTSRFGATVKGLARLDTHMSLRPSMLSRDRFHNIKLKGLLEVDNFYYLSDDTLSMVAIPHIKGKFGTNEMFAYQDVKVDSLLRGTVEVDSADILVSGLDIRIGKLRIGVAADNSGAAADTTIIIPMGGGIKAGTFSLFTISDTSGVVVKDLKGRISMRRYKGDAHLPTFGLNLGIRRLSAGNNHTRMMVSNGRLKFNISKLPDNELSRGRRELRHISDSILRVNPQIPVDSVYILAREIRARRPKTGRRVHMESVADSLEVLEWGATHALKAFLLDWKWDGTLNADRARLFTSSFPIRNRMANLDLKFSNDTVQLSNVEYKAGRSDFLMSGQFTNLKKGLTSRRGRYPLKANFILESDTIDVNEIANALFAGASSHKANIEVTSDEDDIERHLDELSQTGDSVHPLLLPTNIDAQFDFRARHIAYSDLMLNDFTGKVLMYDGALNLHGLKATSDVGDVDLTALYSAPSVKDMNFGFGLQLIDFNIHNFLKLVPAVDSIMPIMRDLSGIVDANIAAASKIDSRMNFMLPTLQAAIRIEGDSLSFLDMATYKKIAKWLMFKDKNRNLINHVSAEMIVDKGEMRVYPFIFDFDRYKLGIQGYNDFDMNLNYHVAVLKSPLPFKFGVNISGNADNMKIRLGKARFNEKQTSMQVPVVNNTRINLINQIQNVFRRGVKNSDFSNVIISPVPEAGKINLDADTLTPADSAYLRREGLIPE